MLDFIEDFSIPYNVYSQIHSIDSQWISYTQSESYKVYHWGYLAIFENANLKGGFIRALQTLSGYSSTKYMTKFLYRLIG